MHLRVSQLEIDVLLYCPSRGSRVIDCSEKNPRRRIREAESSSLVIGRDTTSLFHSYYLWEFGSFLCLFSFVVSLLCNPNEILQGTGGTSSYYSPIISLCCFRAERLFE